MGSRRHRKRTLARARTSLNPTVRPGRRPFRAAAPRRTAAARHRHPPQMWRRDSVRRKGSGRSYTRCFATEAPWHR
jgi:hypothetical protein